MTTTPRSQTTSSAGGEFGWRTVLSALTDRTDLSTDAARWAMNEIMGDAATPAQIAAFGVALKMKGETAAEVAGLADAMLEHARLVPLAPSGELADAVDIVGTGGDRANTVNISTMSSVVVAAAGIPVVKHGNRAASSKSGGADVLEALGVAIALEPDAVLACVREAGIGFCFAPVFHPALRFAGPARREIAIPTVFNVLGPLTNPAQPRAGLIGCAFAELVPTLAGVLAERGSSALVVRGEDGLDELSVAAPSLALVVSGGAVREARIDPREFGLAQAGPDALRGGEAEENAAVARRVFAGDEGPVRDAVVLNAGAAIAAYRGLDGDLHQAIAAGMAEAEHAIDSGAATARLERWVTVSAGLAGSA